ncbi:hypothetical protein K469DRAFT_752658 [Zopfia rhizophila CBS 207.26]|uniref:Protein NO VEIN C-terminal domain-containing protein n=1 Tax=Zopfia rhizophila CBS 207.26 TaxID=1314779 RepID=A0A6A6DUG0_9PEZI|nr:hypothetical protein K469DRAFT_752658 [Zopfia rhizophila CBS 207.26]
MVSAEAVEAARSHIENIRRRKGLGEENPHRYNVTELESLLDAVGVKVYKDSMHFIEEIIQNADDNSYDPEKFPTLTFSLDGDTLRIDCNETGFRKENVEAICSVGSSTKTVTDKAGETVGEKGIGFKSVFKVADVVTIASGPYTFKFDKNTELGMIAPIWVNSLPKRNANQTSFYLKISSQDNISKISEGLRGLNGRSLLFLRRLRNIGIKINQSGRPIDIKLSREKDATATGSSFTITPLYRNKKRELFLVRRGTVHDLPYEKRRHGVSESEVCFAFPLTSNGEPNPSSQFVYAFLPVNKYDFEFLLHGDFFLTTNRQELDLTSPWNASLISRIKPILLDAYQELAFCLINDIDLRYTWIRYIALQDQHDTPFTSLKKEIIAELSDLPVLRTQNDTFASPSSLFYIPPKFCDRKGTPLVMNTTVGDMFLSMHYAKEDLPILKALGVDEMTFSTFLGYLENTLKHHDQVVRSSRSKWFAPIATVLLGHLSDEGCGPKIRKLPIIRVRTGEWFSADAAGAVFFPGEKGKRGIPDGVNAHIVQSEFAGNSAIYHLYVALGVKELTAMEICQVIIETHLNASFKPERLRQATIISHTIFLFNSDFPSKKGASSLWLASEDGRYVRAHEMYFNDEQLMFPVKTFLKDHGSYYFLHPDYLKAVAERKMHFWKWIHGSMEVWNIPRLVGSTQTEMERFKLSPEFRSILRNKPGKEFLLLLRVNWEIYSTWLCESKVRSQRRFLGSRCNLQQEVSLTEFNCLGGKRASLCNTFLPFENATSEASSLPFLDIDDPEHDEWKFLETFGVGVEKNVQFYLRCLESIASEKPQGAETFQQVSEIYSGIQLYAGSKIDVVRNTFASKRLIFIPAAKNQSESSGIWISNSNAIWTGPSMRRFKSISAHYEAYEQLFCSVLQVKSFGIQHILEEMKLMTTCEELSHIKLLFSHLNDAFAKNKSIEDSLKKEIIRHRVFPVSMTLQPTTYESLQSGEPIDKWFIADLEHLEQSFSGRLSLLGFDLNTNQKFKDLYKELGLNERVLSANASPRPQINGTPVLNSKYTAKLRDKADLMVRLISENHDDKKAIAARVRGLEVHVVDSLSTYYSLTLDGQEIQGTAVPAAVCVTTENEVLKIYLIGQHLKDSHWRCQFELADHLENYCHTEDHLKGLMFYAINERNNEMVNIQFARKGVRILTKEEELDSESYFSNAPPLEPDKDSLFSKVEQLAEGYATFQKVRIFSGGRKKQRSPQTHSPNYSNTFRRSTTSAGAAPYYRTADVMNVYVASDDSSTEESGTEHGVPGEIFVITNGGRKLRQRRRKKRAPLAIDEDAIAAGELFMSKLLSHVLPDFYVPEKHWTSVKRTHAGFKQIDPSKSDGNLSSFTMQDNLGDFTKFLVGCGLDECKDWTWNGLTYHIEVMGTEKGLNTEFHVRKEWWEFARKHRFIQGQPRKEICLMVRVFNLGTQEPGVSFYLDPFGLFLRDQMKLEAETMYVGRIRRRAE